MNSPRFLCDKCGGYQFEVVSDPDGKICQCVNCGAHHLPKPADKAAIDWLFSPNP